MPPQYELDLGLLLRSTDRSPMTASPEKRQFHPRSARSWPPIPPRGSLPVANIAATVGPGDYVARVSNATSVGSSDQVEPVDALDESPARADSPPPAASKRCQPRTAAEPHGPGRRRMRGGERERRASLNLLWPYLRPHRT